MPKGDIASPDNKTENKLSLKEVSSTPKIKATPVLSNNCYGLKKARSIAVDNITHLEHNDIQATDIKSCNVESLKSPLASISLPILQTSTNNKR